MYTRHGAPLEALQHFLGADFERQTALMNAFLKSFEVKPLVTDDMVEAALQEYQALLDNPLLELPKLGGSFKEWNKAVMRKILEAAERVRIKNEKE